MEVRLISSPFAGDASLGERLSDHLADTRLRRLRIAVAWARRSGLVRIADDLRRFRARGGDVEIILGIDEGGATLEGLNLVRELADRSFIFHDPQGGTFHPKVYVFTNGKRAVVLLGSANLTRGGLYANYEAGVELGLDLPADSSVLGEIESWMDRIRSEPELCIELDDQLLGKILESGNARSEDDRETRPTDDREVPSVLLPFGKARAKKISAPRAVGAPAARGETRAPVGTPAARRIVPPAQPPPTITARWFKRLDQSGAQQPPNVGTNPTGVLRLTKSVFPIDWRTYFRQQFFGSGNWRRTRVSGQPADEAVVPFEVTIDGRYLGTRRLTVSHAPHREAGQANVTTVLHWDDLMPTLRAKDYTGYWVVLARTDDGRFQLSVQQQQPTT